MVMHRLGAGLLGTFVVVTACASAPKVPVFGTWKVASFSAPGVSAQPSVPALSWVGVSASFTADDARFGGDRCSSPKYTARTLSATEFQQEYHVPAATLGISGDPITIYRVDCGHEWGGRTNTLIVKSTTALLTPSDGTFFELVKSPTSLK
jgi:hypothetical protein